MLRWLATLCVLMVACSFSTSVESGSASDGGVETIDSASLDSALAPDGGLDGGTPCGDGALQNGEECDDRNDSNGDGCTANCLIEPAYQCTTPGEDCQPVTGTAWGDTSPSTPDTIGGSAGGNAFLETCDAAEALVGIVAAYGTDCGGFSGTNGVAQLSPICALVGFDPASGQAAISGAYSLAERGACSPSATPLDFQDLRCPPGQIVSGIRGGGNGAGYVNAFGIYCSPLSHVGGQLAIGTASPVGAIVGPGALDQTSLCATGQIAAGVQGADGQVIDSLILRCVTPTATQD